MKEITHDSNHDLIFYCTHNRSMFRILGIYNFGIAMEKRMKSSKSTSRKENKDLLSFIKISTPVLTYWIVSSHTAAHDYAA